jgi:predicted phage terminase large subunit-like protein
MSKECITCKKIKGAHSFKQWIVYREGSARAEGPRKKVCSICDQKARAEFMVPLETQVKLRKAERQFSAANKKAISEEMTKPKTRIKAQKKRKPSQIQTKSDFERELLERQLAKTSLVEFIKRFEPKYQAGWVHEDICRRLKKFMSAIEAGLSPRLMLFMPPRHGKSLIASHNFPAWMLGHNPDMEIIAASYGSSLPMSFSRKVRGLLREKRYKVLFEETVLDRLNENVEGWKTTRGGGYIPAGVGGGITGKGAHCFIVDDPVKDAEEADSETIRQSTWDWWGSTAYTRLAPNAGVLVIQTRWHDDDLSGRMIMQMKEGLKEAEELKEMWLSNGMDEREVTSRYEQALREIDQWEIIEYPAIALNDEYLNMDGTVTENAKEEKSRFLREKGDALHPDRFDYTRLMKVKRSLQPRHWSALYQQNPIPEEGMFFTKGMFRYEMTPTFTEMPIVIMWDLAIGLKQQNDFTVGVVGALDQYDRIHILEMVRGKWDTHGIAGAMLTLYAKYKLMSTGNIQMGIESGSIQMAIMPHLKALMKKERLYPTLVPEDQVRPINDKLARARPLQGRMSHGQVVFPLPTTNPWVEDVQHELLRFPGGVHDDIVDAMAWLIRVFANISPPKPPKPKPLPSWRSRLQGMNGSRHPMTG